MFTAKEYRNSIQILKSVIQRDGATVDTLNALLETCKGMVTDCPEEEKYCLSWTDFIKNAAKRLHMTTLDESYGELYWNTMLFETPYLFESFLVYMEKNRAPSKRFYEPRKKTLKIVVDDLQDLEDRVIEFYGLSMPSRVGKSTICIFFLAWVAMKRPNSHSAMGGHSGILAKGFQKELLNLFTTEEYTFSEIFNYVHPGCVVVRDKSADDLTITLDQPDRFATITCRGIDGTWIGAVDVSSDGYLYVDDLIRDRQHSLSPIRMEDTYQEYLNKMVV